MQKIGCTRDPTEHTQFVLTFKRSDRLIPAVAYLIRSLAGKDAITLVLKRFPEELGRFANQMSSFPAPPPAINYFGSNNAILPF